jgi:lysophospholipid acyltransferase (LPLAT)-like uncharacterized protein
MLRLSGRLTRVRYVHREREAEALSRYGAVIYAIWHGRMWLPVARLGRTGAAVLVSLSEDGEVIARAARSLGFRPVRGSTSRGGKEGFSGLAGQLEGGRSVALTPDGPRGPRHRAAMGTVALAARTGRPIVPVGAASCPAWSLRSWDRFQVPRPGARGTIVYGEPLRVPAGQDLEPWRRRLEEALDAVEAEADREAER